MTRFASPDLVRAFRDGERFGDSTMRMLEVDPLVLPTGRIVACDPCYLMTLPQRQTAYTRRVAPGRYPVRIALLSRDGWAADNPNRERVACAAVQFADKPVERWEMALRPDWDPITLKPGYQLGYGVDGGIGCFVDECALSRLPDGQPAFHEAFQRAQRSLGAIYQAATQAGQGDASGAMRRTVTDPRYQEWQQEMVRAYQLMVPPGLGEILRLDGICRPARSGLLDPETGANIVAFPSGEGDGCYASYFGLAADGTPTCLVTDFGLLVRSVRGRLEIPVPVQEQSELTHPGLTDAGIDHLHVEWRPSDGMVVVRVGEGLYVGEVRFENQPGSPATCAWATGGGETAFRLSEPLHPSARVLIDYTLRTEAL